MNHRESGNQRPKADNAAPSEPRSRKPGKFAGMRPSVGALKSLAVESQKSRLPQMAAALSYRTLFGLLPMIIISLVVLKAFSSDQDIKNLLNQALAYGGLSNLAVSAPPLDETAFFVDKVEETSISEIVESLVARSDKVNFSAIGAVGGLLLFYAALSMLVEIERAFNQIYRVPIGKSWIRRIFQYWTILTLGTLLLVASFFVGEKMKNIVIQLADQGGIDRTNMIWLLISGYGITVLVSTVLLLLMYLSVPNTRVKLVPALAGALVAAILWEAGKWGFTQYLRYSTSYPQLYGSIALLPLFLFWVYVTWFIVLLGLHISYHLQQARTGDSLALPGGQIMGWADAAPGVVDPASVLALMEIIALGFRDGAATSMRKLVARSGLTRGTAELLLERLSDRGFVHRVAGTGTGNGDDATYTLARSPELIPAADVLRVGYELAGTPAIDVKEGAAISPGSVIEQLRIAQLEAAGCATLASLMGAAGARQPESGATNGLKPLPLATDPDVIDLDAIPRRIDRIESEQRETRPDADGRTSI